MVTQSERRRVLLFAAAVVLFTLVPYLVGMAGQTPDLRYSGFVLGADDAYSYIAKMRLGLSGVWEFYVFYTAEPHDAAPLVYWSYLVPGQIARLFTHIDAPNLYTVLVTYYHALRVVFGVLLIAVIYRFIALFITKPGPRMLALVLATLGGGLGWGLIFVNQQPPEFYIPESFTFLSLLIAPHLLLARATLIGGLLALIASERRGRFAWLAGGLWLMTGVIVPFYLPVIYALLGVWGLLLWARDRAFPTGLFWRCVRAGGLTLPLFGYFLWVFSVNPVFAAWGAQNSLPAPPPWHYLLAYGPYLVAGAFAVWGAWNTDSEREPLLLAWVLTGLVLVYLPLSVQRRLAEGVLIPLVILAVRGLTTIPRRRWQTVALLLATLPASVLLMTGATLTTASQPRNLYVEANTVEAFQWLDDNATPVERGAVVLSRFAIGNKLPAYTGLRPYVGHGPETLNSVEKQQRAQNFFDGTLSLDAARALLTDPVQSIDYVYAAPRDVLPGGVDDLLTEVYAQNGITIYERR